MRAVVTVAIGNRRNDMRGGGKEYASNLPRFINSFKLYDPDSKIICFEELPAGCPPHSKIPYAFKPFAIQEVVKQGITQLLFVDCSIYPVRSIASAWEWIDRNGYLFLNNGHNCGQWTCDSALGPLGITREGAFSIPQTSTGFFGLDFREKAIQHFFARFMYFAQETTAFCGPHWNHNGEASADRRVLGHRHEQSTASIIVNQLGLDLLPIQDWITVIERDQSVRTPLALRY